MRGEGEGSVTDLVFLFPFSLTTTTLLLHPLVVAVPTTALLLGLEVVCRLLAQKAEDLRLPFPEGCRPSVDRVAYGRRSVDRRSVDRRSVDRRSVDNISVDKRYVADVTQTFDHFRRRALTFNLFRCRIPPTQEQSRTGDG